MTRRRAATQTEPAPQPRSTTGTDTTGGPIHAGVAHRLAGAHSREEAEERYVAARDAWVLAMRAASSGKSAALASLAIAQEAYEAAHAERERWINGISIAIPIDTEAGHEREVEAAVSNELAWRVVLDQPKPEGVLTRLRRRIRGR